jgi:hypothetical protein
MNSLRRKLGVLLLPLVLALGPGLTLCVHACQVRGIEVRVEADRHCCASEQDQPIDRPVFESAACCSESDAQLQLTAPVQRTEGLVLYAPALTAFTLRVAFEPAVQDADAFVDGSRGPPHHASGRSRLISYSIARV